MSKSIGSWTCIGCGQSITQAHWHNEAGPYCDRCCNDLFYPSPISTVTDYCQHRQTCPFSRDCKPPEPWMKPMQSDRPTIYAAPKEVDH